MMERQQILIIDDDPDIRKTLSDILKVKGYEPLIAKNGAEGLELLRQLSVNLVIIDLGLPNMSGLEVLNRVKADHPSTEAIILTGNASLDSAIEATNRGAFSYLLKPYEIDQLMLHIRRAIEKHEAEEKIVRHNLELGEINALLSEKNMELVNEIAERKRLEEAMRDAKQRLADIIEFLPDATLVIDKEGKIIAWNRAIEAMTGVKAEKMLGRGDYEYALPFYGERRPILIDLVRNYQPEMTPYYTTLERRGDALFGEAFTPYVRGGEAHLSATASALRDIKGEMVGAIQCIRDNTERWRLDQELRRSSAEINDLYNNAPCGYHSLGPDGTFLRINDTELKWLGYERDEIIGRKKWSDLVTPESLETFHETFPILKREGRMKDLEINLVRKDRSILPVLLNATAIMDAEGQYVMSRSTIFDNTERKQAEKALRRSQAQMRAFAGRLQAAREEERTKIAREIHDELGGAFTGLKIDISLLTKTVKKIRSEGVRDTLLYGMDNLMKLIDATMLTVRRIATELRPGILDDLGILAALEWQLSDFQTRTGIRCEWHSSMEQVDLDGKQATALFRIFQEILTNVIRHAGATAVSVRIHEKNGIYDLEVEDNGRGITTAEIQDPKSLGFLGMHERALTFGGSVTMSGHPGRGTRVRVAFPVKEKKTGRSEKKEAPAL